MPTELGLMIEIEILFTTSGVIELRVNKSTVHERFILQAPKLLIIDLCKCELSVQQFLKNSF